MNDIEFEEQLKKLTEARIQVMPNNMRLSVGSQEYSKEELLEHVRNGDDVGKEIIDVQIEFLQALAKGSIYGNG